MDVSIHPMLMFIYNSIACLELLKVCFNTSYVNVYLNKLIAEDDTPVFQYILC
mgnify:CR=1 FL=1